MAKITIEKLAVIINKGFQGQMDYMEKKFSQVASKEDLKEVKKDLGKRLERVEESLGEVKTVLTDAHVL